MKSGDTDSRSGILKFEDTAILKSGDINNNRGILKSGDTEYTDSKRRIILKFEDTVQQASNCYQKCICDHMKSEEMAGNH